MERIEKFEEIKKDFNDLTKEYEVAKENGDEKALEEIKERYEHLRVILYTSEAYFKGLKNKDLEAEKENATTQKEINIASTKKYQKEQYKANKSYINMVEKSNTLEEYIKNNNRTKFNFVKKHFKKVVLVGSAATLLVVGLATCKSKNTKKDEIPTKTEITTEDNNKQVESTTLESTEDNDITLAKAKENIKLNPISDVVNENIKDDNNTTENDNETKDKENIDTPIIEFNDFETTEVIESLDPHITDTDTSTIETIEVLTEEEVIEPKTEDYIFEEETTEDETEEKIIIDEEEETIEVKVEEEETTVEEPEPEDYTFEEETTEEEEKVIIEEIEETIEVEVVEDAKSLVYTNIR